MHDDPLFLSHFWLIYVHIFHFGKYQELLNSRSKMAQLPLTPYQYKDLMKDLSEELVVNLEVDSMIFHCSK